MRIMVRIYRVEDSEKASRAGYEASYIADLTFCTSLDSCGVILVDIEKNGETSPHSHEQLEEVFIAITEIRIIINDTRYDLKEGDVVFVEPGEAHSFETETDRTGRILALKFPNIKDDKVVPVARSQN
ncbi:MAG: cupin domain-containing protein [Candidatus Thorarchaeota archaeon]